MKKYKKKSRLIAWEREHTNSDNPTKRNMVIDPYSPIKTNFNVVFHYFYALEKNIHNETKRIKMPPHRKLRLLHIFGNL